MFKYKHYAMVEKIVSLGIHLHAMSILSTRGCHHIKTYGVTISLRTGGVHLIVFMDPLCEHVYQPIPFRLRNNINVDM